jgi:RimJ/RimL family protein N-acetyltransferase
MTAHVFRLGPDDAWRFVYARQRALLEDAPHHGVQAVNRASVLATLADDRSATFAIEADDSAHLIAVATIMRHAHAQYAHRARLAGVFVEPAYRRNGFARAVVEAAVEHARSWQSVEYVDLCVNDDAVAAQRLYELLGFVAWGRHSDAADVHGRRVTEIHMALALRDER